MIVELMTWVLQNPWLIFMTIPGLLVCIVFSFWNDNRKEKKLEADPIHMTDTEYHNFNWKRFKK